MVTNRLKTEQKSILADLIATLDLLPDDQREKLISDLNNHYNPDNKISPKIVLPAELKLPERNHKESLFDKRKLIIEDFALRTDADHEISFRLPVGKSRMDLIREVRSLTLEIYGIRSVAFSRFKRWSSDTGFIKPVLDRPVSLTICGYIADSEKMDKRSQLKAGLCNISFKDLVTAHSAYLLLTGRDIFNGFPVRTKSGAVLNFETYGIVYSKSDKKYTKTPVAACQNKSI